MKNYWFIMFLGISSLLQVYSQDFIADLSNKMYSVQKEKEPLDNTPPLLRRVDRIKQARNHIFNELLVKNLPDTDTLFFIEKYEGNFVTGQIWGGKVDTIKYIANFNSNITILTKEELFSPKFSKLTAEWNIEQIDSINDKEKKLSPK